MLCTRYPTALPQSDGPPFHNGGQHVRDQEAIGNRHVKHLHQVSIVQLCLRFCAAISQSAQLVATQLGVTSEAWTRVAHPRQTLAQQRPARLKQMHLRATFLCRWMMHRHELSFSSNRMQTWVSNMPISSKRKHSICSTRESFLFST